MLTQSSPPSTPGERCLQELLPPSMPQIMSQAGWPSRCNRVRPIWLSGLCFNGLTISMGPTLDCEAAIHKMSLQLAQNLYALWTESPHSSVMDATCSFARLTTDDPMEPTEICSSGRRACTCGAPERGLQHTHAAAPTPHVSPPGKALPGWPPSPSSRPEPQTTWPWPKSLPCEKAVSRFSRKFPPFCSASCGPASSLDDWAVFGFTESHLCGHDVHPVVFISFGQHPSLASSSAEVNQHCIISTHQELAARTSTHAAHKGQPGTRVTSRHHAKKTQPPPSSKSLGRSLCRQRAWQASVRDTTSLQRPRWVRRLLGSSEVCLHVHVQTLPALLPHWRLRIRLSQKQWPDSSC